MAYSLSTFTFGTGGRGLFSGHLYRVSLDFVAGRMHLPPSCSTVERRPSVRNYQARQYMVGGHTANIVIDEELRALRQGIGVPPMPTVSAGAGTTPYVVYLRFFDELTEERSSLGPGKSLTGNTTRTFTALPTSVQTEELTVDATVTIAGGTVTGGPAANFGHLRPGDRVAKSTDLNRWAQVRDIASQVSMTIDDTGMAGVGVTLVVKPVSRVSHVESWVAANGGLPRFGTRVRIGTSGFAETIADLALGEALVDTYIPMPTGSMSVIYNDRQLVAGVPGRLNSVFLSAIGFPERYEGLNFKTQFGEPILGLFCYRDYVMLICSGSTYRLQGYTEDDYIRDVLEPNRGGIGHLCNRLVEDYAIIPGRSGPQIFNGAFHPGMPNRRREWIEDYGLNPIAFEGGYGAVNPIDEVYLFFPDANRLAVESSEAPLVPELVCTELVVGGLAAVADDCLYLESGLSDNPGLYYFNKAQTPVLRRHSYQDTPEHFDKAVLAVGSFLYVAGTDTEAIAGNMVLKRMTVQSGEVPTVIASIAYSSSDTVRVSSIVEYGGDIYINGGNAFDSYTWKYSSGLLTLDDTPGGIGAMAELGSSLYLSKFSLTWRRKIAGVWGNFVSPFTISPIGFALYGSKLYFGDNAANIYSLTGTTFSVEHAISYGGDAGHMVGFDGKLYFVQISGGGRDAAIGYFDGVTWVEDHHIFTGYESDQFCTLAVLNGDLVAVLKDPLAVGDCNYIVATSDGTDTTDWTIHASHHRLSGNNNSNGNHGAAL